MNDGRSSIDVLGMLSGFAQATAPGAVDLNLSVPWPAPVAADAAADNAPGWEHSSLELLTGVEVTDFSETISGEVFLELFRR